MKVFMLGWEFPPFISGGLGTACHGLVRGLNDLGVDIIFLLPKPLLPLESAPPPAPEQPPEQPPHWPPKIALPGAFAEQLPAAPSAAVAPGVTMARAATAATGASVNVSRAFNQDTFDHIKFYHVPSSLTPYATPPRKPPPTGPALPPSATTGANLPPPAAPGERPDDAQRRETQETQAALDDANRFEQALIAASSEDAPPTYAGDMFQETQRYAALAAAIARQETFDVVHAHDWMTFPAGMAVAAASRKPLVLHVHSTEFDRSGELIDRRVFDIEQAGLRQADRIIAVSQFTKQILTKRYAISPQKITVVYNALEPHEKKPADQTASNPAEYGVDRDEKIVLFFGRITAQKGPEYFLSAAQKVLAVQENVRFIMAGAGDLMDHAMQLAAAMNLGQKVLFPGFLRGAAVDRMFAIADVYVMPSVSEPFGIAPLEALNHDVPTIISRQSGVSEVLKNVLKVDFWDTDDLANKILAVLRRPQLAKTLAQRGAAEVRDMSWLTAAREVLNVYQECRRTAIGPPPPGTG